MYKVVFLPDAEKSLKQLDTTVQKELLLLTRQLNTLILSFRLGRNLSLNSFCYAARSPTSEDDGLRYFVAALIKSTILRKTQIWLSIILSNHCLMIYATPLMFPFLTLCEFTEMGYGVAFAIRNGE
jgi:hypothetical protein